MGDGAAHDGLFKVAMQDPEVADALVRENLPPEVLELLAPGPPELLPDGFVDAALRAGQSDALLRLKLKDGEDLFVICLVEHKSSPDGWVALQVLRYQVALWERERAQGAQTLSPIVPLVLYHGERAWTVPRRFSALLHGGPLLQRLGVDFEYRLLDAARGEGEALARHLRLRAVLEGLKYGTRPGVGKDELVRVVVRVVTSLRGGPTPLLRAYLTYAGDTYTPLDAETARQALEATATGEEKLMMSLWKKELLAEGAAQGRVEGMVAGRVEAAVTLLRQVLTRRFGSLPADAEARIAQASWEQAQQWTLAALDAPSLDAVLGR